MERVTACQDFLSDTVYREMCDSNPGSKQNILFHPTTIAGQAASIEALQGKKTSFRRIHTEGIGDCFIISLLNGRDGSEELSFPDAVIEEAKKSIGRVLVQHTTVGVYEKPEDFGAADDRPLRLFEADRARACGINLSPRPTLHSLCQDIETQMSARHYVNLLALGAATDALKLGLVVLWVQSKDHSDEYVVYVNEMSVSEALRSWVTDATCDLSTMVSPPAADGGDLARRGSEGLLLGVTRTELTAMFDKQMKEVAESLAGRNTRNPTSQGSS